MPSSYGKAFSGTDSRKLAPGTSHDAGTRRFRNNFDFAVDGGGGTTNSLKIAALREGVCIEHLRLASDVNCAAINFTLGTLADPAKYAVAFAGPAAGLTVNPPLKPSCLAMEPLAKAEDIYLFPSANMPGVGLLTASLSASKR